VALTALRQQVVMNSSRCLAAAIYGLAALLLLPGLSGCRLPAPAEPLPGVTLSRPYTPTASGSPTAPAAIVARPGELYTLTIQNHLTDDIFIFIDGQYRLRVAAGAANAYAGLPSGNYALLYCLEAGMNACAEPIALHLAADMLLLADSETGGELIYNKLPDRLPTPTFPPSPIPTSLEASATPSPVDKLTAAPSSLEPTYTLPPTAPLNPQMNSATLTAVAPTLVAMGPTITAAAMHIPPTDMPPASKDEGFMITVHNGYIFPLGVSMDGQFLMSVPPRMYMWFIHIKPGEHTFAFCPGQLPCSHRTIHMLQDTEVYISP